MLADSAVTKEWLLDRYHGNNPKQQIFEKIAKKPSADGCYKMKR